MVSRLCSQPLGSQRAALETGDWDRHHRSSSSMAALARGALLLLVLLVGVLSEFGDRRAMWRQKFGKLLVLDTLAPPLG